MSDPRTAANHPDPYDLVETSLASLRRRLDRGAVSSVELVRAYRDRIAALDHAGPEVRSVIELGPESEAAALRRDGERGGPGDRGPLHGIPVLVKDNIATVDGMETTAGSLALVGARPRRPAGVVDRLEAAGAIVLGKTNLSEWANFRSTGSSSGWSGRGGQTRNPYVLDISPSGSSSGSGAAIAASFGAVALGTETNGSILSPAAANGLVGIKPTVGLTSRAGVIPISHTQDTVGPMTRTVAEAAALLTVIAGTDLNDPATARADLHRADYLLDLDPDGLRGARIGIARATFWGYSPAADRIAEEAIRTLRDAGAVVIDPADIPSAGEIASGWPPRRPDGLTVLLHEFKAGIEAWLGDLDETPVRTLAELIEWNRTHADRELPYFGQELFELAAECGPLTDAAYTEARATTWRLAREDGIDRVMAAHQLDALMMPTMAPASKIDLVNGEAHRGGASTPAANAGYPAITVPAGQVGGRPVGVCFTGRAWSERTLIRIAYGFEQHRQARFAPGYVPAGTLYPPLADGTSSPTTIPE